MKNRKVLFVLFFTILIGLLSSCSGENQPVSGEQDSIILPIGTAITQTPFLPETEQPTPVNGNQNESDDDSFKDLLIEINNLDHNWIPGSQVGCSLIKSDADVADVEWVLTLTTVFNSIPDSVNLAEFENFLNSQTPILGVFTQIITTPLVADIVSNYYGISDSTFKIIAEADLREELYESPNSLLLIPFDQLTPAYKVLKIDGLSPFDQNFSHSTYGLTLRFDLFCPQTESLPQKGWSNRDPEKFTSVLLTGTTALTRAIAYKMEINGNQYPGEKVKMWFDEADLSHVSNEVSYYAGCPNADPNQDDLFFCGRPEYVELFTYLGVDVIELTGNHLVDKGVPPLISMMELFNSIDIPFYAAGVDAKTAAEAVYFEVNGNRIAFLGCNAAGPNFVYATDARAGVNYCDMDAMAKKVEQVVQEGYLPIVTFQYWETYQFDPMPWQREDSQRMIRNGAVIVSGSQAHLPMTMEIYGDSFIHYGLGNMFFDQMDIPVVGTRREFADRHIFYNGKYLGVELLTAMLEDYSQPRPMTDQERQNLLQDAFEYFTQGTMEEE